MSASSPLRFCAMVVVLAGMLGCGSIGYAQKSRPWRLTLSARDKGPYGYWLAHELLKEYFPASARKDLRRSYEYTSIGPSMNGAGDSVSLLLLAGYALHLSEDEWSKIVAFAGDGNEVMIFGSIFDSQVLQYFGISKQGEPDELDRPAAYNLQANQKALLLEADATKRYGYTGRHIRSAFLWGSNKLGNPDDSSANEEEQNEGLRPQVLGRNAEGRVNFMRYSVGEGHITLHAAPLSLSNYFLLQPGNRAYVDSVFHSLPANISKVYWSDFQSRVQRNGRSPLEVIWRHPSTRAAMLLFLAGMLLYILFSMKRRRRIVPVIPPVGNSSVQFVETIGRLYYNQGVHSNLAEKIAQHFLDRVRTLYVLDTAVLNEAFVLALTAKSGVPETDVRTAVTMLNNVRAGGAVDENYLYRLYTTLQKFYERQPHFQS